MTERVRFRVQAAEMDFLLKVRSLSLLDKVKSTDIRQSLNIVPLLLRIEQSQLHWYLANNAMQGPPGSHKGCPYGTRTDLAAGAAVVPHGLTARV